MNSDAKVLYLRPIVKNISIASMPCHRNKVNTSELSVLILCHLFDCFFYESFRGNHGCTEPSNLPKCSIRLLSKSDEQFESFKKDEPKSNVWRIALS